MQISKKIIWKFSSYKRSILGQFFISPMWLLSDILNYSILRNIPNQQKTIAGNNGEVTKQLIWNYPTGEDSFREIITQLEEKYLPVSGWNIR